MGAMSLDADNCDDFIQNKLFRTRGKCEIYARQSDVIVAVKQKTRQRVPSQNPDMTESNDNTNVINVRHDIWFHIAMRIDPEDVQAFALICKETARLVASRAFWLNLHRRHCSGTTSSWNLELPAQLQLEQIRNCDTRALRLLVIKALFHCHRPLKVRLERGYHLDWLLGRNFVSCWQENYNGKWMMCYKFRHRQLSEQKREETDEESPEVVNNWEALAKGDSADQLPLSQGNNNEGVVLLFIVCPKFVPTPTQLSYNQHGARFRLCATRELLCTDMSAKNLELDFAENKSQSVAVTVKYPLIRMYKVMPWWHPKFEKMSK